MSFSEPIIDIRRVISNKNPKLASRIPGFVYKYVSGLIHQKELNHAFSYAMEHNVTGERFAGYALEQLGKEYTTEGAEKLPGSGRFIFASNHPLGGLDALVMIDCLSKHYPELRFIVNDILMHIAPLKSIFLPINKFGRQNEDYVRIIRENLESDRQMLIFPAGICSRKRHGKVSDLKWKNSFIKMALTYHRDVIPVYFDCLNSPKFYRIAQWRERLGIKANLEMILLPDEMFRQRHGSICIRFGDPIPWQTFDSSKTTAQWCQYVRDKVYGLANYPYICGEDK